MPTYQFYFWGEHYGTLEKQFCLVKDKFSMEVKEKSIGSIMDNLQFDLDNIVFDNSAIISYDNQYLSLLTAMAIMVAREIARDRDE